MTTTVAMSIPTNKWHKRSSGKLLVCVISRFCSFLGSLLWNTIDYRHGRPPDTGGRRPRWLCAGFSVGDSTEKSTSGLSHTVCKFSCFSPILLAANKWGSLSALWQPSASYHHSSLHIQSQQWTLSAVSPLMSREPCLSLLHLSLCTAPCP